MPTSAPAKSRKPQVTLASVPTGFAHCWEQLTDEFKVFVVKAEALGNKSTAGKTTTKEQLEVVLSTPPKLRAALMNTPKGAIYLPENIAFLESFYAAFYGPRTPANSQLTAQFKVVGKALRLDLERHFGQVIAGMFNLSKHYEAGMPIRQESKQAYDTHLRLLSGVGELRRTIPHLFAERSHLAKIERDGQFTRRSNAAFNECSESPPKDLLATLGISQLKQALLRWWCEIPGYKPRYGLADFTHKAAGQFCSSVFDPQGTRKGDPFDAGKVRESVRSLRLMKRDWSVTGVAVENNQVILTLKTGQRVPFERS